MAIKGDGTNPTHHVVLTDGYRDVGLIITDNSGKRNERTFRRFPRTDQGESAYTKETQTDWSLGFGNERFEDNRSAYWRSQGLDLTHSGAIVLGPQFYYATGYRNADQYMPSTGLRQYTLEGSGRYRAVSFLASANYDATRIKFYAAYRGKPGTLTIKLCSDNAGVPGTVLKTATLVYNEDAAPEDAFDLELVKIVIGAQALTSSAWYWILLSGSANNDPNNCWVIGGYPTTGQYFGVMSSNGTDWTNCDEYFFRITDADDPGIARFYEYKGQLYTAISYDDKGDPRVFMNGWRGACDDNSGNMLRLSDATQTGWAANAATGCVARIVAGPATEELDDWRAVVGSGSGYLTCDALWNIAQSINDDYVVLGSPKWFEIPKWSGGLTGQISGIAVANGIVYMCLGNQQTVWGHREYNYNGVWLAGTGAENWSQTAMKAGFVMAQNDPISGDTLWFGRNVGIYGIYRPEVWRSLAPAAWVNGEYLALNNIIIDDLSATWTAGATTVEVTSNPKPDIELLLTVKIGMVTAVNATPTAGGNGYVAGEYLFLAETGSGLNCKVHIVTVDGGGAVTAIHLETTDKGWDYTTGPGKPTTGGSGTGCTVEITEIANFSTGTIAYKNLSNPLDLRFSNYIRYKIFADRFLASGVVSWGLDNNTGLASPYTTVEIPTLTPGVWSDQKTLMGDTSTFADAASTNSVGLVLNTAQTKTFVIALTRDISALNIYDPIEVGEDGDNITGFERYGDPSTLWVFTETGMGEIRNNLYNPVELRELEVARDPSNGKAHTVNDVYLYFSWHGRMQRFYRQTMEDVGPDFPQDFGNVRGKVSAIQTYAGRLYVAIDGGTTRKSMVLVYKGHAWHEIYTSAIGERIRSLYIQAIPGKSHRLWIGVGGDLVYMPIELDPVNIPLDSDFKYRGEGWIELSWIHTGRPDLKKIFRELLLFVDNVGYTGLDTHRISVAYRVDDETDEFEWVFSARQDIPYYEQILDSSFPSNKTRGYRLQIKLRLQTSLGSKSPIVRQVTQAAYRIPKVKFGYSFLTNLATASTDLRGDDSKALGQFSTMEEAVGILDNWATNVTPLFVKETTIAELKERIVVLEPSPTNLFRLIPEENLQVDLVQITLNTL